MGAGCLLEALASIGLTLWGDLEAERRGGRQRAGRLRMNMLRMVLVLQTETLRPCRSARPVRRQPGLLRTAIRRARCLCPWSDETRTRFDGIRARWAEARTGGQRLLPPTVPGTWPRPMPLCSRWTALWMPSKSRSQAGPLRCTCSSCS